MATFAPADLRALIADVFTKSDVAPDIAGVVADGISSHGVARVPP